MRVRSEGYVPDVPVDDATLFTEEYAKSIDKNESLRHLRDEFLIPTIGHLKRETLNEPTANGTTVSEDQRQSIYLCGNSLGVQPKVTAEFVKAQLDTWATKGVFGHFKEIKQSPLTSWLQLDEAAAKGMSKIVGANPSEVAVMQTLTANLHLLLASFYRPTKDRYKIIFEGKAFPSDHYAIESHIQHHGISAADGMVLLSPANPDEDACLQETDIYAAIDKHADSAALIMLPGIQYYTGQFFDMDNITHHAHSKGIMVGWDLAHAVGNIPVQLHEWDVDFAVWCTYKYLNCGPGAIGGLFVHEKHGKVEQRSGGKNGYYPRLAGWWGSDKGTRFNMDNNFTPIPGAGGWQLSNPSALDLSAVLASMSIYGKTDMETLRSKSTKLTGYLEYLLTHDAPGTSKQPRPYKIITPKYHHQRGAQLSIRLEPGLLDSVMHELEDNGVVVDERKPDVIRVAPAPLYNNYEDAWKFVQVFKKACVHALATRTVHAMAG